jgi:uncharacterized protein (DUF1697 family)
VTREPGIFDQPNSQTPLKALMDQHRHVALLRGINVGTRKRIAMADLREVFSSLGCERVRTILNSGNVVFDSDAPPSATDIEGAIASRTGVSAGVVVVSAERFRSVLRGNPLAGVANDPSRLVITFIDAVPDAASVTVPDADALAPERLEFGDHAIYQWCPDGISESKLPPQFFSSLGSVATGRNQRTAEKILAALED